MQLRDFRATLDFAQRIVLEWIYAAKTPQQFRVERRLLAGPVVFLFPLLVFVFGRRLVGIAELICDDSTADSGLVQQCNQMSGGDRVQVWRQLRDLGPKQCWW